MTADGERKQLLVWIDAERDDLIAFLSRFVRSASPNPPGDTRGAAAGLVDVAGERALRRARAGTRRWRAWLYTRGHYGVGQWLGHVFGWP